MSHLRRLDHVGITAADLDRATTFFAGPGLEAGGSDVHRGRVRRHRHRHPQVPQRDHHAAVASAAARSPLPSCTALRTRHSALRWRPAIIDRCGGSFVFISYRRQLSWQLAQLVRDNLAKHDFDTFVDVKNLDSGEFDRKILDQIEAREHFIVLLQPGSLNRIGEKGDWLRREIAHALGRGRNIVPVTADGFEFPRNLALPPDVERLPSFQAVTVAQPEYFNAAMKLLRKRFLKTPTRPAARPLPETRSVVEPGRHLLASPEPLWNAKFSAPVPPAPVLTCDNGLSFGAFHLAWSKVSGAQEYVLERARGLAAERNSFVEVYRGMFRDYIGGSGRGPQYSSAFQYRVRASVSGQAGKWSNSVTVISDE